MTRSSYFSTASAALLATGILYACADQHAMSDDRITAQVKTAIAQHPDLGPPNRIYVDTRAHIVYLTGTVYDDLVIANAKDVVRNVPGVSEVVSDISVTQGD
jgi:osmotically-inducible protein OsmY